MHVRVSGPDVSGPECAANVTLSRSESRRNSRSMLDRTCRSIALSSVHGKTSWRIAVVRLPDAEGAGEGLVGVGVVVAEPLDA